MILKSYYYLKTTMTVQLKVTSSNVILKQSKAEKGVKTMASYIENMQILT